MFALAFKNRVQRKWFKCIKGFVATFELFGEAARTADLDLCFNGEFAKYTAQGLTSQPAFTCSKLTIETLEQGVEYVQS